MQILLQQQFLCSVQQNQLGDKVMPSKAEPQCKDDGCQHEKENLMLREKVRILERTNSLLQEKIEKSDGMFTSYQ